METAADSNEDVQGYIIELLLTLRLNAELFTRDFLDTISSSSTKDSVNKLKSKSLEPRKDLRTTVSSLKREADSEQKKKSATTSVVVAGEANRNDPSRRFSSANHQISPKTKSATLSRKLANEYAGKKTKDFKLRQRTRFKHQLAYKKSQTLSLMETRWEMLQEETSAIPSKPPTPKTKRVGLITNSENLRLLVQIFWSAICLLESDFEHEFLLAIEIIERILSKIDLGAGVTNGQLIVHKNEFRTHLELFAFKINWPNYPGLQNLLIKGCTCSSPNVIEASQRLLIKLIPHCSKLNFVEPRGAEYCNLWGLAMNLFAILPTMIYQYEKPSELCVEAARAYHKQIREQAVALEAQAQTRPNQSRSTNEPASVIHKTTKIEQLKNLAHVINLYGNFGKDKLQWTKCVITYLGEFFEQCQSESTNENSRHSRFYCNWLAFLTELLDRSSNNPQFQACVFTCLNSLLTFISLQEPSDWTFVNEELMRAVAKYVSTPLWNEALDIIKLAVNKSSSLSINRAATDSGFSKKELPGRTLEFCFDFDAFVPVQLKKGAPPLNLLQFGKGPPQLPSFGWKRPHLSQVWYLLFLVFLY